MPEIYNIFQSCEDLIAVRNEQEKRETAHYETHQYSDVNPDFDNIHNILLFSQFLGRQTLRQGLRESSERQLRSETVNIPAAVSYLISAEKLSLEQLTCMQRYVRHSQLFTDEEIKAVWDATEDQINKVTPPTNQFAFITCP